MRFVDANVFIFLLTSSPKESHDVSRRIMQRILDGEEAVTSTAVLQEVVDWLEYNNRRAEIKTFLIAVNSYPTLRKESASWGDMISALDCMERDKIDYVDALSVQIMRRGGVSEIYSNDKDFDRVDMVSRIWE